MSLRILLQNVFALPLAGLVAGTLLWIAFLASRRLLVGEPLSVRWAGTTIIVHSLLLGGFHCLSWSRAFWLVFILPVLILLTIATHVSLDGRRGIELMRSDLQSMLAMVRQFRSRWFWAAGGTAAIIVAARVLRGILAPPMASDTKLYHAVRAGRWVQASGLAPFHAPDSWGYYEYFPPGGDVPWAWAELITHSDALLGPASALVWLECLFGAYCLARQLGVHQSDALQASLCIALIPCVAAYMTSAYVDNSLLAFFFLGATMVARTWQQPNWRTVALSTAALSLACQVKYTAIGYLVVAGLVLAIRLIRTRSAAMLVRSATGSLVASMLMWPPLIRGWVERASPLYPFPLRLGPYELFDGNEELNDILTTRILGGSEFELRALVKQLFWPGITEGREHLGLGPLAPIAVVLGLWTLGSLFLRDRGRRGLVAFVAASAALTVAPFFSAEGLSHRTIFAEHSARFIAVTYSVLILFASTVPSRLRSYFLALVLASHIVLALPLGWGQPDAKAMGEALLLALPVLVVVGLAKVVLWPKRRVAMVVVSALAATTFFFLLLGVRLRYRYTYYGAMAEQQIYDVHVSPRTGNTWAAAWQAIDDGNAYRIAATSGWNGFGQNWPISPLMGTWLQNWLVYVPITANGAIIDYRLRDEVTQQASFEAWHERLLRQNIDFVVAMAPVGVERLWMNQRPNHFELFATSKKGSHAIFRVVR